ncbi:IclR family transcriptional regulator C-terminal domain-containing protein [Streptomyces sp. NBC_00878]|uniref:IclR family transcriptional regulator domain-containing protein n=1 Tax=Streptomyces sp. NBC_00878 TaxID=2975854 RepID=UPI00224E2212|nr:IclR family transcriptional regulator C-terminal domain-containing protein [Streptomyces sp. NBC_00878]MCX4906284.1 helix-turn-helix domain-containing protein [Streptomyces sp. NBC_00878]
MPPTHLTPARPDAVVPAPVEAVAPLMRGITVLHRLTEAGGTSSLSGLEKTTGLARSTVDRIAATLARMGYVRLDGRDAVLTPRLMELGNAYLAALRLPRLLDGRADALADELDESVSLAVGDRDGIRFIHQATRRRAMSLSFRIGDLLPAERTAPGPLFAAQWTQEDWAHWRARRAADPQDLGFPAVPPREHPTGDEEFAERTREAAARGWALDDQLIEPGLVAVSVPVRDRGGRTACVVSVVSHTSRHTADSLRDTLLPRLRAAVRAMERDLREAPAQPPAAPAGLATWTGASKQELGREFIESLARGLTVITAFGEGRAELTLTEVAQATGLARATARRALITLEHLGQVTAHGRTFALTPRVLALGFPPLSRTTLPRIAAPHLAELADRLHDSASLAVLAGDEIQYTARVATSRIMSANITVGTRFPAYATSLGRVMLADIAATERGPFLSSPHALTPQTVTDPVALEATLDHVREAGYALVDGELEEGLRSIAVPVRDRTGRVVAAVNVAMHSSRRTVEQCVDEVLPELAATAGRIEGDLRVAGRFARVPVA